MVQKSGYESWGRPAGMDKHGAGCSTDDSRQVSKFNVSLRIQNNTPNSIGARDWYAFMVKKGGSEAYVCFYGYAGGQVFPDIPAGQPRDVTFAGFVEVGEQVGAVVVETRDGVRSNTITFP